jgi:hypothetical protein
VRTFGSNVDDRPFVVGVILLLACKPPLTPEERCRPQPLATEGCRSGDVRYPVGCRYQNAQGCSCGCLRSDRKTRRESPRVKFVEEFVLTGSTAVDADR